jgi:hypothetical protein
VPAIVSVEHDTRRTSSNDHDYVVLERDGQAQSSRVELLCLSQAPTNRMMLSNPWTTKLHLVPMGGDKGDALKKGRIALEVPGFAYAVPDGTWYVRTLSSFSRSWVDELKAAEITGGKEGR